MSPKASLTIVGPGDNKARPAAASLRILIADDDRDTAETLATILRDEGHDVNTVLRGDEVIALERGLRPQVLIVDINMPGMSGYAIAREVRQRRASGAPVMIGISGVWTKTSERSLAHAVGFDHYLLKPCEPSELIAILDRVAATPSRSASV
ncbi:MAG TPA: response regulator [Burkholderiales bacterium]|nr:response regulator [Burkholderiales bacterium]